jgi:hypothetical protein
MQKNALDDVRSLAARLHLLNASFHDVVWARSVDYEPELKEDYAEFEVSVEFLDDRNLLDR